jgi:sulfatase modifying factor 1
MLPVPRLRPSSRSPSAAFACSKTAPEPGPGRPRPRPRPRPDLDLDPDPLRVFGLRSPRDGRPTSCPSGMVLVDGDYCTELELTCKKSWYAKWNDKTICEEFEQPSKCIGNRRCTSASASTPTSTPTRRGNAPARDVRLPHAQHLCAAEGKRVCTETEWTMACEGPEYKPYPTGTRAIRRLATATALTSSPPSRPRREGRPVHGVRLEGLRRFSGPEIERLWQGVESGSQPECVSDYGVWDMPGNADELASSETPEPTARTTT